MPLPTAQTSEQRTLNIGADFNHPTAITATVTLDKPTRNITVFDVYNDTNTHSTVTLPNPMGCAGAELIFRVVSSAGSGKTGFATAAGYQKAYTVTASSAGLNAVGDVLHLKSYGNVWAELASSIT